MEPLHLINNRHISSSADTQSCLVQQFCTDNSTLMDLSYSSTDNNSGDILEESTMTHDEQWTTAASASACKMLDEEEDDDDENDIVIWDRPPSGWVTSLVRLRWCCRPSTTLPKPLLHDDCTVVSSPSSNSRRSSRKQHQKQQSQPRPTTQAIQKTKNQHASQLSHVVPSHTLANGRPLLLHSSEMEPYSPSSVNGRYQPQLYYHQQQQQPYPISPRSALSCTASVETCSDLSMDTSQMTNFWSPSSPVPTLPSRPSAPPPTSTTTRQHDEKETKVYYPPPPLSPRYNKSGATSLIATTTNKVAVRIPPSTLRQCSLSDLAPTPTRSYISQQHQQQQPVLLQASLCTTGKPPLPRVVGSSSSATVGLMVPSLNQYSNHTQTSTTTNTTSTSTYYNGAGPPAGAGGGIGGPSRVRILSEYSKATMISSSSRHRRQHHNSFEFSVGSLNLINSLNAADDDDMDPALVLRPEVPPCVFIEVVNNNNNDADDDDNGSQHPQRPRHYSWSSWDDEDKYQRGREDENDSFAVDDDDDDDDNYNHFYAASADSTVPIQNLQGQCGDAGSSSAVPAAQSSQPPLLLQQYSLETPPPLVPRMEKPPIVPRQISALSAISATSSPSPLLSIRKGRPGAQYLPICPLLDSMVQDGRVVVSGWAAVSLDARIHQELTLSSESGDDGSGSCNLASLKRSDLAYVQLIQLDRYTYKLCIHRRGLEEDEDNQGNVNDDDNASCASMIDSLLLTRSFQVSSEEVGGRAGRCIQLRESSDIVLCTLLPVSLPDYCFCAGSNYTKLVSREEFAHVQHCMFTPFSITETSSSRHLLKPSSSLSVSSSSGSSTCSTESTTSSSAAEPSRSGENNNNNCAVWDGREYYRRRRFAPDEQHDATRHLLFALDTAIQTSLY